MKHHLACRVVHSIVAIVLLIISMAVLSIVATVLFISVIGGDLKIRARDHLHCITAGNHLSVTADHLLSLEAVGHLSCIMAGNLLSVKAVDVRGAEVDIHLLLVVGEVELAILEEIRAVLKLGGKVIGWFFSNGITIRNDT